MGELLMKTLLLGVVAAATISVTGVAFAAGDYNDAPWGDAQVQACLRHANASYTGGGDASNVSGQNKAHAWCECLWNETPDSFGGDLVKYADTHSATNKKCEKYSGWE